MIGDIMSISRLRMGTDGKGISTLVAFFDCPLSCKYCINDACHETHDFIGGLVRASYTSRELAEVLNKDEIYYKMTGGGVVFGGGEPLLQSAFIHEVCGLLDEETIRRVETSLNVPWRNVEPILDDIDEWIIDIKELNAEIYRRYTGTGNKNVINNLFRMSEFIPKEKLHIRVPRIPKFNTEEDVHKTVEHIRKVFGIEPEVFEYYEITHK